MSEINSPIEQLKNRLVELINEMGPIKATEVPCNLNIDEIRIYTPELMSELVKERRVIELEYALPSMPSRLKSLYFPTTTHLKIITE